MKKLLICPFFGKMPRWYGQWAEHVDRYLVPQDYSLLTIRDEDWFRRRVADTLGVDAPPMAGTGKIWDYRPAFGVIFEQEIREGRYGYWGHTDFDVVFGRVERFWPDEMIADFDLISDHPSYVCGPWALYRTGSEVEEMFQWAGNWQEILEDPVPSGWIETSYTSILLASKLRYLLALHHAYLDPQYLSIGEDGELLHGSTEIPFFHFRRTKEWPL